ncbi:MAG: 50S ribosomal protein L4 [Deltaproteobacteria bacterium]|nr:50S ribosomal protein L4 [Deltaproteobacteria bacterium]
MPTISLYNLQREIVGEIELPSDFFAPEVNQAILHEVVCAQLASRRSGNACTKRRSEVNHTTRKVYKQKGTGAARHGDMAAPLFVGGGKAHGPKPRDYSFRPPRKVRIGALRSALTLKLQGGKLWVLDSFEIDTIKTKRVVEIIRRFDFVPSVLIVERKDNENLRLSARNLPTCLFLPPEGLNVYDILRHEHLVLTKGVIPDLAKRFEA